MSNDNTHLTGMLTQLVLLDETTHINHHPPIPNQIPLEAVQHSLSKLLEYSFMRSNPKKPHPSPDSPKTCLTRGVHDRKQTLLLNSIDEDVNSIVNTLNEIDGDTLTSQEKLCILLDQLEDKVWGVGLSLNKLSNNMTSMVCNHKDQVLEAL